MRPIIKAPYKPTIGDTPATKAKATASGTSASATVRPENTSSLSVPWLLSNNVYFTDYAILIPDSGNEPAKIENNSARDICWCRSKFGAETFMF
jgi:hypothetical protein